MSLSLFQEMKARADPFILISCWAATSISLVFSLVIVFASPVTVSPPLHGSSYTLFLALPWIIGLATLSGLSLVVYYILVVSAIIMSAMLLAKRDLKESLSKISIAKDSSTPGTWDTNYWIMLPKLLAVSFFAPTIWYATVRMLNLAPTVPAFSSNPLWQQLFGFASASVWEEIIFRLLFIGIPIMLTSTKRDAWKMPIIGGEDANRGNLRLIVFSSLLFAAAHAFGGWDWYKVPPTFITGLALGYVFVKRGLPGAIILHFALNYSSMPMQIFPSSYGFIAILLLVIMVCGAYYSLEYAYEICKSSGKRFQKKRYTTDRYTARAYRHRYSR